jgi:hypothetical protein
MFLKNITIIIHLFKEHLFDEFVEYINNVKTVFSLVTVIFTINIKSDFDIEIAWDCSKPPVEELYAGSVSILKSNNTMDINFSFNTCSSRYKNNCECIEFFK